MSAVTVTYNEQDQKVLQAVCDAALRNQGLQMLQACTHLLNKLGQAQMKGNGHAVLPTNPIGAGNERQRVRLTT